MGATIVASIHILIGSIIWLKTRRVKYWFVFSLPMLLQLSRVVRIQLIGFNMSIYPLLIIFLYMWFVLYLVANGLKFKGNVTGGKVLLVFVLYCLFTVFWAVNVNTYTFDVGAQIFAILLFFIIYQLILTENYSKKYFIYGLLIYACLISIYTLFNQVQYFGLFGMMKLLFIKDFWLHSTTNTTRHINVVYGQILSGKQVVLVPFISIYISLYYYKTKKINFRNRKLYIISLILSFALIVFSSTRGAYLGIAVSALIWLYIVIVYEGNNRYLTVALNILKYIFYIILLSSAVYMWTSVNFRGRNLLWTYAIDMLSVDVKHFLLGYGVGSSKYMLPAIPMPITNQTVNNFHNSYLQLGFETGFIGLGMFFVYLRTNFVKAYKYMFQYRELVIMNAGYLGLLAFMGVDFTFSSFVIWIYMAIMSHEISKCRNNKKILQKH